MALFVPFVILFCYASIPAKALDCDGGVVTDTCRTVIPSIDDPTYGLRYRDLSGDAYKTIIVTCYHATADPDAICAGGGDFDRTLAGEGTCTGPGLDNGATIIQDNQNDCFYRKNFGLNGVVDARQCGIWGDGVASHTVTHGGHNTTYNDVDLLNNCLDIASLSITPTLQNSLLSVTTGGGVVVDNTRDIQIPLNVTLECGGTFTAAGNNDYRIFHSDGTNNLTNAIVIDPTNHGMSGSPVYYSIKSSGKNATLKDCTVEAGAGALPEGGTYPKPRWEGRKHPLRGRCARPETWCTPERPARGVLVAAAKAHEPDAPLRCGEGLCRAVRRRVSRSGSRLDGRFAPQSSTHSRVSTWR
ncbi:MAG TPA: hypothetical protein VHW69_14905 [Rhizomicrobium sp.]|nr:hypothetical protein [Rhizomicrobium sp.]